MLYPIAIWIENTFLTHDLPPSLPDVIHIVTNFFTSIVCNHYTLMKQRRISIEEHQYEFLQDQRTLTLAPMVRSALDEVMTGERDIPDSSRRTDVDVVKTTVLLREDQYEFLNETEMNFSAFASQVIDERMEIERQLSEMGE